MLGGAEAPSNFGVIILYFVHTSCVIFKGAYYEQLQLQTFDSVELLDMVMKLTKIILTMLATMNLSVETQQEVIFLKDLWKIFLFIVFYCFNLPRMRFRHIFLFKRITRREEILASR